MWDRSARSLGPACGPLPPWGRLAAVAITASQYCFATWVATSWPSEESRSVVSFPLPVNYLRHFDFGDILANLIPPDCFRAASSHCSAGTNGRPSLLCDWRSWHCVVDYLGKHRSLMPWKSCHSLFLVWASTSTLVHHGNGNPLLVFCQDFEVGIP